MSEFNSHLDFLKGNNLIRSAQNALSKPGLTQRCQKKVILKLAIRKKSKYATGLPKSLMTRNLGGNVNMEKLNLWHLVFFPSLLSENNRVLLNTNMSLCSFHLQRIEFINIKPHNS